MSRQITTERLVIRAPEVADGDDVVSVLNNLDVSRWLVPIPHPFTHSDLRIVNEDGSRRWSDLAAIPYQGKFIGGIGMGGRLGYYIAPCHWGQGYGMEAATAAVAYSFDVMGVTEIRAGYFVGNLASGRILSGLGFKETGRTQVECAALKASRASVDVCLTKDDWQARP